MKTKGFTLVELLVVIAILAILATVSVVGYTSFIDSAKDSNAETEMNTVKRQIDAEAMTLGYEFGSTTVYTLHLDGDGYSVKDANGTLVTIDATVVAALAATIQADVDFGAIGTWTASGTKITFTSTTSDNSGSATWVIVAE